MANFLQSMGQAAQGALTSGVSSGISGLISGGISSLFSGDAAKKNYEYNVKLMREQQRQQREQFEYERRASKEDSLTAAARERSSLRAAGLSSAGDGAGQSAAQASGNVTPSLEAPSISSSELYKTPDSSTGFSQGQTAALLQAQLDNINADTEKKLKDAGLSQANMSKVQAELDNWKSVQMPILNKQLQATLDKTMADKDVSKQQKDVLQATIPKIEAEISKLAAETDRISKLTPTQIDEIRSHISNMDAATSLADRQAEWQALKTSFGQYGIGMGTSLFDSVAALGVSGKAGELVERLLDSIGDAFGALFDGLSKPVDKLLEATPFKKKQSAPEAGTQALSDTFRRVKRKRRK